MKKLIFLLLLALGSLSTSFAQTQISGYLDNDPTDGISGSAITMTFQAAIGACRTLVHDGKTDWYLPSYEEIALFSNGVTATGIAPGCTGLNCNWVDGIGNTSGLNKCWTRSVAANNGHNLTYGSTITGGQFAAIQDHQPQTVCAVRCVR